MICKFDPVSDFTNVFSDSRVCFPSCCKRDSRRYCIRESTVAINNINYPKLFNTLQFVALIKSFGSAFV